MIGTSLALALAPLGLDIAIVEAVARGAAEQPSFDDRTTALSRSTQRMFEAMDIWPDVRQTSTPIDSIHVSDKGRFGFSHIEAAEQGVEALGYVIINRVLGDVLQSRLADTEIATLLCPARLTRVSPGPDNVIATIETDDREVNLTCSLLVAADGARSTVRDMLGITAQHKDYDQHAIIGNLLTELPVRNRAFERFTAAGPLALLPLTEGRSGFVWTVHSADAERVMQLDDADFLAELQSEFGYRLGDFSRVGHRVSFPLTLSKATRLTAARSVLVGNAAHGLHPVSAQGFNLGMRDVAALCDCIADEVREPDGDFGSVATLDRFSSWRRSDQRKLVHFTDHLVRLFGSRTPGVTALRNIGMLGFDLVPGIRRTFARHTMGLAGKLPRLSRGVPLE